MSRRRLPLAAACIAWAAALLAIPVPAAAQDSAAPAASAAEDGGDCSQAEKDVAAISGEILVCGSRADDEQHRLGSREEAQKRYAQETMFKGDPQAPDVAGAGIFRGKPTIGGLCVPGLQKCPPPPAIMVDFAALPEAPPGSDADRISKGLAPIGNDTGMIVPPAAAPAAVPEPAQAPAPAPGQAPPQPPAGAAPLSPSGSASPAAVPPG